MDRTFEVVVPLSKVCRKGTVLTLLNCAIAYDKHCAHDCSGFIYDYQIDVYVKAGMIRERVERYFVKTPHSDATYKAWHYGLDDRSIERIASSGELIADTMSTVDCVESNRHWEECDVTIWQAEVDKATKRAEPEFVKCKVLKEHNYYIESPDLVDVPVGLGINTFVLSNEFRLCIMAARFAGAVYDNDDDFLRTTWPMWLDNGSLHSLVDQKDIERATSKLVWPKEIWFTKETE